MNDLIAIERVIPRPETANLKGRIVWTPVQSLWTIGNGVLGLIGVVFLRHGGFGGFVVLTGVTFVLVGMAGPYGMMRDWHQRQATCPPHPSHGAGFWRDAWWQMHCAFQLDHPPDFVIEAEVRGDPVYQTIERTWRWQQVPVAIVLFAMGGIGFVLWGVCLRVFVTLTGHWAVGHFAHRQGAQGWVIDGLPVQGFNLPRLGLLTFGENWHGNHHAFPHSAKLGVEKGQADPGFWLIKTLEALRLVWDVQEPEDQPARDGLRRVS